MSAGQTGRVLAAMRTGADLTQADMARIAGVNRSYLSNVERGRRERSSDWSSLVANALGTWLGERSSVAV